MKKKFILFLIFLMAFGCYLYHHTTTLEVTNHQVRLGPGKTKLRVAHISDLHTQGLGKLEQQLIHTIKTTNVDLIIITGDIATPSGTEKGYQSVLEKLKAPKGVFYVSGNWEYWEPIQNIEKLLKENNIYNLTNKTFQIEKNLWLIGFDDSEEGLPQIDLIPKPNRNEIFIGLFHSPIFFDKVAGRIPLSFAGHSHGGQIRFPFLSPFWVPQGTGRYDLGWFEKEKSKLFVSRGIGTSILPIRFNCSPELAIIEIFY